MTNKIATIIVTFNRINLLLKVLEAVEREVESKGILIIVDNNSSDGTEEELVRVGYVFDEFSPYEEDTGKISINIKENLKIIYLKLDKNIGGSGGFYYGVKLALKEEWGWLWFLDDDAKPQPGCLKELLKYAKKSDVLVPLRISNPIDVREFPAIRFNMRNPFLKEVRDVGFYKNYEKIEDLPETIEVEDFSFEGPLIKRRVIEEMGPPKKDIFISGDDTDYALRILRKYGKKHLLITRAIIERISPSKKSEIIPLWKEYYLKRNYYYTHYTYGENVFVKIKPFFLFLFSIIKNTLKMRMSVEKFKVNLYAFWDSIKKKMPIRYKP